MQTGKPDRESRMNENFRQYVNALHPALEHLMGSIPFKYADLRHQTLPKRGLYLFSECGKHLYAGRSDDLRQRLGMHCRPSAQHNQATFAFRLAKEVCGIAKASYKPEGSRADLASKDWFKNVFEAQKQRLRQMEIRFIEEIDDNRQALLEMYVAIALGTPYTDFKNH
jgi:predicted GIY-YIG superfamily endonuclease